MLRLTYSIFFSTKTYKTLCVSAKGYGPLLFVG